MARSYAWSLRFESGAPEPRGLSREGRDGYEYARSLARNSGERRHAGLRGGLVPVRLTVNELAQRDGTSPVAVHRKIKQARIELFGKDLSEAAIYRRLRWRERHRGRTCAEPDCETPLPLQASAARNYCDTHRDGAARARRHRRVR